MLGYWLGLDFWCEVVLVVVYVVCWLGLVMDLVVMIVVVSVKFLLIFFCLLIVYLCCYVGFGCCCVSFCGLRLVGIFVFFVSCVGCCVWIVGRVW